MDESLGAACAPDDARTVSEDAAAARRSCRVRRARLGAPRGARVRERAAAAASAPPAACASANPGTRTRPDSPSALALLRFHRRAKPELLQLRLIERGGGVEQRVVAGLRLG